MARWLVIVMGAIIALSACSNRNTAAGGGLPQVCDDYFVKTKSLMDSDAQAVSMMDKGIADAKENWGKMDKEQQQQLTEICEKGLEQFKMLESQMNQ